MDLLQRRCIHWASLRGNKELNLPGNKLQLELQLLLPLLLLLYRFWNNGLHLERLFDVNAVDGRLALERTIVDSRWF